jgi:hypothetical protein
MLNRRDAAASLLLLLTDLYTSTESASPTCTPEAGCLMLPTTNAGPDDYHLGPHIMVAVPNGTGLSDYTANPRSGGAYINRVHGTDIPYPVIPLHATP